MVRLNPIFENSLILPTLTRQVAIFEFANNGYIFKNNKAFINHILLILK